MLNLFGKFTCLFLHILNSLNQHFDSATNHRLTPMTKLVQNAVSDKKKKFEQVEVVISQRRRPDSQFQINQAVEEKDWELGLSFTWLEIGNKA